MPRIAWIVSLCLAAGCSSGFLEPPPGGTARIRLIAAPADSVALDLIFNGRTLASSVPSGSGSAFVPVSPGAATVSVRYAGRPPATTSAVLAQGASYSVIASGPSAGLRLLLAADTAAVPIAGQAKFRVVHAAPSSPPLDVYLTLAPDSLPGAFRLLFPFDYGVGLSDEFPGYVQRDPGQYRLRFTARGTLTVLLDSGPFDLAAGSVVTAVLGQNGDGSLRVDLVRGT